MTISPIGPFPPPSTPSDDRPDNNGANPARPSSDEARTEQAGDKATKVELSPEARRIRNRQAEISRLQVAERAAESIVKDARDTRRMFQELREARNANNEPRAAEVRQRIEQRARQVEARRDDARFGEENLFDGREMKVKFEKGEETIRMPDASREVDRFTREVRSAIRERREPSDRELAPDMGKFMDDARRVRTRLEKEVRDSIAGAVRESSDSRPRDAEEAERLIRSARSQRADATSQRPRAMEQITHRAVNLLR